MEHTGGTLFAPILSAVLTVESAQHLPRTSADLNPYVIIIAAGQRYRTATVPHGGAHPVWGEVIPLLIPCHEKFVKLVLMDERDGGDQIIGTVKADVRQATVGSVTRLILPVMVSKHQQHGLLCLSLQLSAVPSQQLPVANPEQAKEVHQPTLLQRFLTMPVPQQLIVESGSRSGSPNQEVVRSISDCQRLSPHAMAHATYSLAVLPFLQQQKFGVMSPTDDHAMEEEYQMPAGCGGDLQPTPSVLATDLARLGLPEAHA